MNLTTLV